MSRRAANENDLLLTIQLATLELKFDVFIHELERRYNPNWPSQPRVPAGEPLGSGRWSGGGSRISGAGAAAGGRPIHVALGARLIGKRLGLGDDEVIVHCYYRDMLGNDFTIEQDATLERRPTWPARPVG